MKKAFENASIEILKLSAEDILTVSDDVIEPTTPGGSVDIDDSDIAG